MKRTFWEQEAARLKGTGDKGKIGDYVDLSILSYDQQPMTRANLKLVQRQSADKKYLGWHNYPTATLHFHQA